MHVNFTLPPIEDEKIASERQAVAVSLFYQTDFGPLSFDQARRLLACREFARLSCEALFKRWSVNAKQLMSQALAAFLLSDPEILLFAFKWSESAFARGSSSPRVRGTPIFPEVEAFASYVDGMIKMSGWTDKELQEF